MRADGKTVELSHEFGKVSQSGWDFLMVSGSLWTEMGVVVLEAGRTGCAKAFREMFGAFGERQESRGGGSLGCVGWNGRSPGPREGRDLWAHCSFSPSLPYRSQSQSVHVLVQGWPRKLNIISLNWKKGGQDERQARCQVTTLLLTAKRTLVLHGEVCVLFKVESLRI